MKKYYDANKLWHLAPSNLSGAERKQWLNDLAQLTKSTRLQGHYDAEVWRKPSYSGFRLINYDIFLYTDELHLFVKQRSKELGKKIPIRYFTENQKENILH